MNIVLLIPPIRSKIDDAGSVISNSAQGAIETGPSFGTHFAFKARSFDGMFDAVRVKADQEGVPFAQILRRELIEIPQINGAIKSSNVVTLKLFHGLNEMALPHFEDVLARSSGEISKTEFMAGVDKFIAVLDEVENYNLTVPAASSTNKELVASRATAIGKWIVNRFAMDKSRVA